MKFSEKYRPSNRDMLIGSSQRNAYDALMDGKVRQTLLFSGPSGSGKTTLARIYAAQLLGIKTSELNKSFRFRHLNSREIGIKYFTDKEGDFKQALTKRSIWGGYEVFLFDEVDGLKPNSEQAVLLTVLENLPSNVIIMFATLNPSKLRGDFISRSNKIFLSTPTVDERKAYVLKILELEGVQIEGSPIENPTRTITKQDAAAVYENSQGNLRTLVDNIEQLLDGYFTPTVVDVSKTDRFVPCLFRSSKRHELFQLAEQIDNYNSTLHSICFYAVAILKKDNVGSKIEGLATNALRVFGHGLPENVSEKVGFYTLLIEFYNNL